MIKESKIEEILDKEHFIITGHAGNSMYPLILADDQLLIMKLDKQPHKYDIVVYKSNGKYVLHRIVDIKDDYYIIRGDNTMDDEYIYKEEILGYLDTIYRKNEDIKITEALNRRYFYKAYAKLFYRKIIRKIRSIINHE